MKMRGLKGLFGDDLMTLRDEIARQNRMAIRYFAAAGIPVSIASIAAQAFSQGYLQLMQNGCWMLVYFLLLALASAYVIPENCRHSTLLVYVLQAPVMIIAILLGTVWDPNHQALTYLMFMVVMPVFVLDRPTRVIGVMTGWNLVFLFLCMTVKDPSTRRGDFLHVLEFFLSSITVTLVVLKLRFDVLRGHERARYHMEHDVLTGARNRQSLEARIDGYLQKPLLILMGDLDQMSLLNDFYGREFGDNVLLSFSSALQELFGKDDVYRYGGDEMLCVIPGGSGEDCLPRLTACREKMALSHEGHQPHITCSFSYVTGCPKDAETFRKMVQLAEIQVHKARKLSGDNTIGSVYDEGALRSGIVEANISTHLHAYETNKLTGLPGADYFISRCEELLDTVALMEARPVIGFINLLRFQAYNDALGYTQGDELAHTMVRFLREAFPSRHIAYISSGRFGVMCYLEEAEPGILKINNALRDYSPNFSVSIKAGFAEYQRGDSVLSLLDRAKLAHDSIYREPGRSFRLYDKKLDEERRFRQYIVSHIDEAIEKGWIQVCYQPIIRAITGEICNMEALSRWDDPQYGYLLPWRFIGALEDERLIYKLNLHVVNQVLRDFKRVEREGLALVPVSVNLSRRDFSECDMVERITAFTDASGFPRSLLKIEITESAFMENPELLKREVDRFRANGFEVWMDDFGSEYSTLNLLNELNFDLIKIDMQFMKNFSGSQRNSIIVDDIVGMCKRLGITTLVEGVETKAHYEALRRLGSEKLQGFYFARPMPLEEILNDVRSGERLKLEQGSMADYHARLGHINLHTPLSSNTGFGLAQNLPAGIVELRGDSCTLVRGNEALYSIEEEQKIFPVIENKPVPLSSMPEPIARAIVSAASTAEWTYTHGNIRSERNVSLYVHRVTESPDGAIALLLVVLPG